MISVYTLVIWDGSAALVDGHATFVQIKPTLLEQRFVVTFLAFLLIFVPLEFVAVLLYIVVSDS